jgi:ArsR family transcriptional regulator, arsenate/arsenite/antimonite-responsive transcriptional repressor
MQTPKDELIQLLEAARDPIRLQLVALLGDGNRMSVNEIASQFRLSRPAVSHHLKVLKTAGIVRSEKSGQKVYYWLDRDRLVAGLRELADAIENRVRKSETS